MAEKAELPNDTASLPPTYAPSETYTESPPPAYRRPGMAAVRIAKIVCFTLLAMTFVIGFFVVTHKWVQSRECHCEPHEAHSTIQHAALLSQAPSIKSLDNNGIEEEINSKQSSDASSPTTEKAQTKQEKEVTDNAQNMETLKTSILGLEDDNEQENAAEEAMKKEMEELSNRVKLPVDLLLGNPALAGRNVHCKVQKKQQKIAEGIMTQAIIVTCDDEEKSIEDNDSDGDQILTPILPPGMRRLKPPMSLLGSIMKILAARPRSNEFKPTLTQIGGPLPFPLRSSDGPSGPVSFPLRFSNGPSGPIPFPLRSSDGPSGPFPFPLRSSDGPSGPFPFPLRSSDGPGQFPVNGPMRGPFPGPFTPGVIHMIPIRKMEITRPEPEDEEIPNPILLSSSGPVPVLRHISAIKDITGTPQQPPMGPPLPPSMIYRSESEDGLRPFPFPFPQPSGFHPIRVIRIPTGGNIIPDDEEDDEEQARELQEEGPFPLPPFHPLMNLLPASRTRIIHLRPKPRNDNNELPISFPFPRGAYPLEPRELPPIHIPPVMPLEASGRALPAPVALPEVRVMRLPFRPQPQQFPEARVMTHMEVQQPPEDINQPQPSEQEQQTSFHFNEAQEIHPNQPPFEVPENEAFGSEVNEEFGPPKTHTVIESAPEPFDLEDEVNNNPPFQPMPRLPEEIIPSDTDDEAYPQPVPQLPEPFLPNIFSDERPHQSFPQLSESRFPNPLSSETPYQTIPERVDPFQPSPQFQPRFVAHPPPRFAREGRTGIIPELNPEAEVIPAGDDNQPQEPQVHHLILN